METKKENIVKIDLSDIESVADAIRDGITTVELLAEYLDADIVNDCLVLQGSPIFACDEGGESMEFSGETTPGDAAQEYVDDGDWVEDTQTRYFRVSTWRQGVSASGEIRDVNRIQNDILLEAQPPTSDECGDDHKWVAHYDIVGGIRDNPGVWYNGGGLTMTEVCTGCGMGRHIDTWADDGYGGYYTHEEYILDEFQDAIQDKDEDEHEDETEDEAA